MQFHHHNPFTIYISTLLTLFCIYVNSTPQNNWDPSVNVYPKARRDHISFTYESLQPNGNIVNVTIGDPYNWLETDVDKSNETKSFVDTEMQLTLSYLNKSKDLESIRKSITSFYNYNEINSILPFGPKNKKKYLYSLTIVNNSRPIWYIASEKEMEVGFKDLFNQNSLKNNNQPPLSSYPGKPWLDENLLSENGADSIVECFPSPDGKNIAYAITSGGGDVSSIYIRNTSSPFIEKPLKYVPGGTGRYDEVIPQYVDAGVFWISNSSGFFYDQELRSNGGKGGAGVDSRIQFHTLGTPYNNDILIVRSPKDNNQFYVLWMTADKDWLVVARVKGVDDHNSIYVTSLKNQEISINMKWISIRPDIEVLLYFLGSINSTFYFKTDADGALNGKVVSATVNISTAKSVKYLEDLTDRVKTTTIIPERSDALMEHIDLELDSYVVPMFDMGKLLLYFTKNASHVIEIFDLKTGDLLSEILPKGHGTVVKIRTNMVSNEIFLFTESVNKPNTIHRISMKEEKVVTELVYDAAVPGVDLDLVISEHHYSISKDGTKIPYDLFYKKGTKFDGSSSAILYSYGSYGIIVLPEYAPRFLDWIFGFNGIVILAYPRGGGENGAEWHRLGMLKNRQNTVDDVLSVAEELVTKQYAGFGKIVVNGGSAGGTSCMVITNQAREGLLGGALCDRGLYDMLRYTVMNLIGPGNIPEFGDPNNASDFNWLRYYSPLQNVNSNKIYPTVLLFGTAEDDRVSPTNGYKMIATLQHDLYKNPNPLLLYVQSNQGHSGKFFSRVTSIDSTSIKNAIIAEGLGLRHN